MENEWCLEKEDRGFFPPDNGLTDPGRRGFEMDEVNALIAQLEDTNANVRCEAAMALGTLKSDRAVEPLIAQLKDKDKWVRGAVARALGEIGDNQVEGPLIAQLEDPDDWSRWMAAEALVKMGSVCAVNAVVSCLESTTNAHIRQAAAVSLGELRDARAVEPLMVLLVNTCRPSKANKKVRRAVAKALMRLREPGA